MAKLRFEECENCKDWNGNRLHCANVCEKPYEAWDEFNRLKDLEEQGLLIRLPCKVGDTVFVVGTKCLAGLPAGEACTTGNCEECRFNKEFVVFEIEVQIWLLEKLVLDDNDIWKLNKTVFLTKKEAEAALERMGCE